MSANETFTYEGVGINDVDHPLCVVALDQGELKRLERELGASPVVQRRMRLDTNAKKTYELVTRDP